jgi:tRNA pseudouridine13 synthase
MREANPVEQAVGVECYVSDADGVGGRLRASPEDFRVREREAFDVDVRPLDADPGSYPHLVFRATLRAWDTNDFAAALSDALKVSRERVSWAGTKDKHAVTTQLFSVRYDGTDLPDLDGADVEPLGRAGRPVLFGDLAGNDFEVVVRDPDRPERVDAVAAALRAFAADGDATADTVAVPNFFGQQRFGSKRPITHRVGLDVVAGDWEAAAVRYVCASSDREPDRTREAREQVAENRDWRRPPRRCPATSGTSARSRGGSPTAPTRRRTTGPPSRSFPRTSSGCSSTPPSRTPSTGSVRNGCVAGCRSAVRSSATSSASPTATASPTRTARRSSTKAGWRR